MNKSTARQFMKKSVYIILVNILILVSKEEVVDLKKSPHYLQKLRNRVNYIQLLRNQTVLQNKVYACF